MPKSSADQHISIENARVRAATCLFGLIVFLLLPSLVVRPNSQTPEIRQVIPAKIFPDMFIGVEGVGLYHSTERTWVIFSQNARSLRTYADGGGMSSNGLWRSQVRVPDGLDAGLCKIEVEVAGKRSAPVFVNISEGAEPPNLTSVSRQVVQAGYFVWVEGAGFSNNQILEFRDAEGQLTTKVISGVSTAGSIDFTIPKSAYSGIATFRVVENRGSVPQFSNELRFEIRSGPIPVSFNKGYFVPIARGQWFELNLNDSRPLINATKVEIRLIQGGREQTSVISNFRRMQFQVPRSFAPGQMVIQSRTWIGKDVSEWSQPQVFEISEVPRPPVIRSVERIPVKAEALFKQEGKTVAILPIYFGVLPRTLAPKQLKNGTLEIYTRFWDQEHFTKWERKANYDPFNVANYRDHNFHPEYYKKTTFTFNPFFKRVWFENTSAAFFTAERGNNLTVYGDFFVRSAKDLQLIFQQGRMTVKLSPTQHEFLSGVVTYLPRTMPKGVWRVYMLNKRENLTTEFPLRMRLE